MALKLGLVDAVVGVEINSRAIMFSKVNAALNNCDEYMRFYVSVQNSCDIV